MDDGSLTISINTPNQYVIQRTGVRNGLFGLITTIGHLDGTEEEQFSLIHPEPISYATDDSMFAEWGCPNCSWESMEIGGVTLKYISLFPPDDDLTGNPTGSK